MDYEVDFNALDKLYSSISNNSNNWLVSLDNVNKKVEALSSSSNMSGTAADNIKSYMQYVHKTIVSMLMELVSMHSANCRLYWNDYRHNIDKGLQNVLIKSAVLRDCKKDLDTTRDKAINIDDAVAYVLRGVSDIFSASPTDLSWVDMRNRSVATFIVNLDESIVALEDTHYNNDFINTAELKNTIRAFINEQLSADRNYRTNFTMESLTSSEVFWAMYQAGVNVSEEYESKKVAIKTAIENEEQRAADLEALKEEREKKGNWIKAGVAVLGSVVLIVVTAGTATPLVCAGVGAVIGAATAATDAFVDNYVENGHATIGMDWSDFTKNCVIGAATGFVSGYAAGASTIGSGLKQPISKALSSAGTSMLEKGVEGVINTTWEVGEAIVDGKSLDEIIEIAETETEGMLKEVAKSGVSGFVSGGIGGKFDAVAGDKSVVRKATEGFLKDTVADVAENVTDAAWDIGSAALDSDRTESMLDVVIRENKEFATETAGDIVENAVSSTVGGVASGYNKSHKDQSAFKEGVVNVVSDTVSGTVGTTGSAIAKQGMEVATGDRDSIDVKEIWDEDLKGGAAIAENAGKSIGKNIVTNKSNKFNNELTEKDYNKDGKVEVVQFDKYSVLKEDYDAARKLAGKGEYKGKTAQDILGLPKNTAISEKNVTVKEVDINMLKKSDYKGRKDTTVKKFDITDKPTQTKKK